MMTFIQPLIRSRKPLRPPAEAARLCANIARREELAAPHARAGGLGGLFLFDVVVRYAPVGQRPAVGHEPGAQIVLPDPG